jgi:hypothetical protein
MMKRRVGYFLCVFLFLLHVISPVFSNISAQLELVLSDDSTMIHGEQSLIINLRDGQGAVLWSESHETVYFTQGVCRVHLGKISKIDPFYFYGDAVKLSVIINEDEIDLPMHSIGFSMYSYAADIVNYIHMDGVFHTNTFDKSIGINIDVPTPNATLQVNGAVKLGDIDTDALGVIRWRNNRLEGRHLTDWELLDVRPDDKFSSKWTKNDAGTAFYVTANVLINTTDLKKVLNVGGDVAVLGGLDVLGTLQGLDASLISIGGNYSVVNGKVKVNRLLLSNNDFLTPTEFKVSGTLIGDGFGVTGIGSENIKAESIGSSEIADAQVVNTMLMDNVVSGNIFKKQALTSEKFSSGVQLSSVNVTKVLLSSQNIVLNSISQDDLADDFNYSLFHFLERSVGGHNFELGSISVDQVTLNTLERHDFDCSPCFSSADIGKFTSDFVLSKHISPNAILMNHFILGTTFDFTKVSFNAVVGMEYGGTGVGNFTVNRWIVVSQNQMLESSGFNFLDTQSGSTFFSVPSDSNEPNMKPILLKSSSGVGSASFLLGSDRARWQLQLQPNNVLSIASQSSNALSVSRISMVKNGFDVMYGIGASPNVKTKLNLGGAITLGNQVSRDIEGVLFYDGAFKYLDNTKEPVTINAVSYVGSVPSYLYANNVTNSSGTSRVLLGESLRLNGEGHIVMGGKDIGYFGWHNIGRMGEGSVFFGQSNVLDYAMSSVVFADNVYLNFGLGSSVSGADHVITYDNYNRIGGDGHRVGHASYSTIDGASNVVLFGNYLDVYGMYHDLSFVERSTVLDSDHQVSHSQGIQLQGSGSLVSFSRGTNIDGALHGVDHVVEATILGDRHLVVQSGGAFSGERHSVIFGTGQYQGRALRHFGVGSPDVKGKNNVLLGEHNGRVVSNSHMSIGASQLDSHALFDEGIVLHAPGGIDIVSYGTTVAHLGAHAGSWSHVSDQRLKFNMGSIYPVQILDKVSHMDISEWQYHGQDYVSHIGPMAQDFFDVFSLGNNNRYIQSVDMDGVILSSIQGLGKRWQDIQGRQVRTFSQSNELQSTLNILSNKIKGLEGEKVSDLNRQLTRLFQLMHEDEQQQTQDIHALSDWMKSVRHRLEDSK